MAADSVELSPTGDLPSSFVPERVARATERSVLRVRACDDGPASRWRLRSDAHLWRRLVARGRKERTRTATTMGGRWARLVLQPGRSMETRRHRCQRLGDPILRPMGNDAA